MAEGDQMREAMMNMLEHRAAMTSVDRTGWTREQWVTDAQALMNDLHGSVQSLVNGHVLALIEELDSEKDFLRVANTNTELALERALAAEAEVERIGAVFSEADTALNEKYTALCERIEAEADYHRDHRFDGALLTHEKIERRLRAVLGKGEDR